MSVGASNPRPAPARCCHLCVQLVPTIGVDFKAKVVQLGGKTVVSAGRCKPRWLQLPCCACASGSRPDHQPCTHS